MKYQVQYIDKKDRKIVKVENNLSKEEIIDKYRQSNYRIIDIKEYRDIGFEGIFNKTIKPSQLSIILQEASILIEAGMDIKRAFKILANQEVNKTLSEVLSKVEDNLNLGYGLSQALERTGKFPKIVVNIVAAGEESSSLSESLKILADYYRKEEKLKSNIKNALYYPMILLIITILIVFIIVGLVLPQYMDLYQSFGIEDLPLSTSILMRLSLFVNDYFFLILIILAFILLLGARALNDKDKKIKIDKLILALPVIGPFRVSLDLQRYSGIFSLMTKAGLDHISVLNLSSSTVKNTYLEFELQKAAIEVENGKSLYKAMDQIKELDRFYVNLINIGEQSSSLEKTMMLAYKHYSSSNDEKSKKIVAIFEPLIIIILGLVIGFIVIAIVMPSFNLINHI